MIKYEKFVLGYIFLKKLRLWVKMCYRANTDLNSGGFIVMNLFRAATSYSTFNQKSNLKLFSTEYLEKIQS